MKRKYIVVIAIISAIAVISVVSYVLQPVRHSITYIFEDGSEYSPLFGITYGEKNVVTVRYQISGDNIDLSSYTPYFHSSLGDYYLDVKSGNSASWELSAFDLLNYTLDDGRYEVRLIPSGSLGNISLPPPIVFTLNLRDDRTIDLVFT